MNESINDWKKKPVQVHQAEVPAIEPITSDRDFITFVRNEANLAFRMMRAADELNAYLMRSNQQLIDDVLAKGVVRVRDAANCRKERF